MKKIIALLLAVVMVLGLVACSSSADKTPDTTPAETTDNTPADTTDTETKTDDTAADDTAATASGKVYYLNFKPEFDEALQKLASDYTAKTGSCQDLHRADRRCRQGCYRCFRHLLRHPDRRDGQERSAHHLQHRQHVRPC